MYFYLADFVGTGTRKDPFRAPDMQPGATILDLRPDCTVRDGHAILASPHPVRDRRVRLIAEQPHEIIARAARRLFGSRLRVDVSGPSIAETLFRMLVHPPSGRQTWNPLTPSLLFGQWINGGANPRRYELWMGGALVMATPVIAGGASFSDDFNRANVANDLGANWTELLTNSYQILNGEVLADPNVDDERVWMWATNCDTADHFSEIRVVPAQEFSWDLGPAVRVSGTPGTANCYLWTAWHESPQIDKLVANTQTTVAVASDFNNFVTSYGRASRFEYTWTRLHASGSSLTVNLGPRGAQTQMLTTTDTTHASALGVGVFQYAEASLWDDWYGGDGTGEQSPVTPDPGPFPQKKIATQNGTVETFDIDTDEDVTAGNSVILILATGPTAVSASDVTTVVGSTTAWQVDDSQNNGTNNSVTFLRAVVTGSGPLTVRTNVPGTSFFYCGVLIETEPLIASPLTGTTKAEDVSRHVNTGTGTNTAAGLGFSLTAMSHDGGGSPRVSVWGPPWTPLLKNTSTAGFPLIVGFKRTAPGDSLQGRFTNLGDVQYYALTANYELAATSGQSPVPIILQMLH
jgi:hypothetical protein